MSFVLVENLSKSFDETKVFEGLNFKIEKGEFITLLGPSGCGKSTLLRCLAGLNDINAGSVIVDGKDITGISPKDRNITMVFQSYALFPNMTVEENIAFGLKMKRMKSMDIKEKVAKYISMVELDGREEFYPSQLSGGQKQRVALARALVVEPKILLLDEPLSALDAKIRKNLRLQIRKIQKELSITTIFVTHDQEEALIISDRIFLMDKGTFAQIGTPEEIYTSPASEFVARFMGNYNVLEKNEILNFVDEKYMLDGNVYAIRPEAISIVEDTSISDGNTVKGVIEDFIVLGNVIRYNVGVGQYSIVIDVLNKDSLSCYERGKQVEIYIPINELKKVG